MNREEQLLFCKRCQNRQMDMNEGLLCSITGQKADFEDSCGNFQLDERAQAEMADSVPLTGTELYSSLNTQKIELLRSEQNFSMGIAGSIFVGLVGAGLWAAITVATGLKIGYMALAIGAGVGFTMQFLGKGIDQKFGIAGAIIAVLSCVLGNFFTIMGYISNQEGISYIETLMYFDYSYTFDLLVETAQLMDLLFYGIAGFEGYKFAFRRLNQLEVAELGKR